MTFDEFFIYYMKDKFKMSKIVNNNAEQMILSIIKYSPDDQRIDMFRKFLNIGDDKIKKEIFDCYIIILKILPFSFYKVFEEEESEYLITFEKSLQLLTENFPAFQFNLEFFDKILDICLLFKNEKEIKNLFIETKRDIFYLTRFYNKFKDTLENLLDLYKTSGRNEENYLKIAQQIILSNKEYNIDLTQSIEILKRNFKVIGDVIQIDSFLDFFVNKYTFMIKTKDFIRVATDSFFIIFNDLDKNVQKIWDFADFKKTGIIFYKEFESVMNVIMGSSEFKWKIPEYFK
jgi:hypothetical protein